VERFFTIAEAEALLAEALPIAADIIAVRADLVEGAQAVQAGERTRLPAVKALEARLSELLDWFGERAIQVKGYAPLLIDFPMQVGDRVVLLCWLENEPALAWYHDLEHGFLGRRPLAQLDLPGS
jgi:hypothetical protein